MTAAGNAYLSSNYSMSNKNELVVKMALDSWNGLIGRTTKLIDDLSDETLAREIAPGKNTGIYVLGHIIAVDDAMLPLLAMGDKMFPELEEVFLKNPDKSGLAKPPVPQLREQWTKVHNALATKFAALSFDQWMEKHTSVSDEAFVKEPHRNRMNILLSRTVHLSYHWGQLVFLQK